ncbi:MAG: potassium channel protein [Cyanobacteria bacterium P01_A01_bin.114]
MESSLQRIVAGLVFFGLTVVVAVGGYILAGWAPLDAIYMVVITVFGVGYGEVNPLESPALKIFTILVIISGALSVAYIVSGIVQAIAAGEVRKALHFKRMSQTIANLNGHVIVCGYGRIGQRLAQRLAATRTAFVVLDSDPLRISEGQDAGYLMYLGNAADESSLQSVGIGHAKALATVLPDDAMNVFISLTARELNPALMILARGELPSTEKKLHLAGADHVVAPATISAMRIAHLLTNPAAVDFLSQGQDRKTLDAFLADIDIQITELPVVPQSSLVGVTIGNVEVKGKGTFIIVAVRRHSGETLIHPDQETRLAAGDSVLIMGHQGDMPNFIQRQAAHKGLRYRGIRIR